MILILKHNLLCLGHNVYENRQYAIFDRTDNKVNIKNLILFLNSFTIECFIKFYISRKEQKRLKYEEYLKC